MRVKNLAEPVAVEPPRSGEDAADCVACNTPDDAYIWVSERWRVRGMDRPTGLPMVLILECRSHLDIGDLPNLLAAELGVMTVRLERAIRSLDGVARVHVNRWGDGSAHLHMWFLARPYGRLQLRGTFLSLWDDLLPVIPEEQWLENLALVAEWLAGFGGRAIAEPPHIHWQSPSTFGNEPTSDPDTTASIAARHPADPTDSESDHAAPAPHSDLIEVNAETRDLSSYAFTNGNGASSPANQEPPTPEPTSSQATTPKAEDPQTRDASGTGTAPTTANSDAPMHGSPSPADTPKQDAPAAEPPATEAGTLPEQHDSNAADPNHEGEENTIPHVVTAPTKPPATNAPHPH